MWTVAYFLLQLFTVVCVESYGPAPSRYVTLIQIYMYDFPNICGHCADTCILKVVWYHMVLCGIMQHMHSTVHHLNKL